MNLKINNKNFPHIQYEWTAFAVFQWSTKNNMRILCRIFYNFLSGTPQLCFRYQLKYVCGLFYIDNRYTANTKNSNWNLVDDAWLSGKFSLSKYKYILWLEDNIFIHRYTRTKTLKYSLGFFPKTCWVR